MYWFCTNLVSVGQAKILRIDGVREFFKIPKIDVAKTKHLLPEKKKGFTETFKESKIFSENLKMSTNY